MIAIEAEDLYDLLAEQAKQAQGTRNDLIESNITEKIQESIEVISLEDITEPEKPRELQLTKTKTERQTSHKVAKHFGTNDNYVAKAKKVKEYAPELTEKVKNSLQIEVV